MPEGGRNATQNTEEALIRATRAFHISGRGMSDIAYNYGFMPSGRVYVLRGFRSGGHTFGHNDSSLAFVGFGNYETAKVPEDMERVLPKAAKRLVTKRRLTKNFDLRGHRDVGAAGGGTACPGKNLYALIPGIRKALRRRAS